MFRHRCELVVDYYCYHMTLGIVHLIFQPKETETTCPKEWILNHTCVFNVFDRRFDAAKVVSSNQLLVCWKTSHI